MRAVALLVLAGCFNPSPQPGAPCNTSGDCPDGLECAPTNRCEKPGSVGDANDDVLPPDTCTTGVCDGDVLIGCGQTVTCASGCAMTPAAHCRQLSPSNGLTTSLLAGATADINLDKLNFDGTDGSIRRMNDDIRLAGDGVISGIRFQVVNNVAVWTASSWTLPSAESWSFGGTRPVALFANTAITIAGTIDVGGSGSTGGPGGSNNNGSTAVGGCRGRAGRLNNTTHGEGGGGGGGATPLTGANGGSSNIAGATGIGGGCATNPSTIPLAGGNGGGEGGAALSSYGGGGGGAIALVAMERVTITGDVAAPGAGGANAGGNGGGGGGGGGAIFVEAPTVAISGRVTANGGGGGAPSGGAAGARGSTTSATPALGGLYSGAGSPANTRGGNGGSSQAGPTVGQSYNYDDPVTLVNTNRGGGGGGAVGRIEIKRVTGGVTGLASPAAVVTDALVE